MGQRGPLVAHPTYTLDRSLERWISPDGSHLIFPFNQDIHVAIRPEVFEPVERRIEDYTIRTVHPVVLARFGQIYGVRRPKDKLSSQVYDAYLESSGYTFSPELLEPFEMFHELVSRQLSYRAKAMARGVYIAVLPERTRARLDIGRYIGWHATAQETERAMI
jgi:hypothetical protein